MAASFLPLLLMILVQLVYAGMNVTSKLAIESGMNPLILVAYRQLFATVAIAPFAYWLEGNMLPRLTKHLMVKIFLSSITGITGNQMLYFLGLKFSTATIACALINLLPAFTFVLAIMFRQESMKLKNKAGVAKITGTILCVSGALLLSFYHGKTIGLGKSSIHWRYAEKVQATSSSGGTGNMFLGPLLLIASTLIWALWFIIQADISKKFPAPYTSTGLMCVMASFQCLIIAVCDNHRASDWSLRDAMRLCSALYAGIICTGLTYCLMSWTIERKGPLYVSVFTPLQLVLTAILSWALLQEKLYVGTAIGSLVIVLGLYAVLWGKGKEVNNEEGIEDTVKEAVNEPKSDIEFQPHVPSNGNRRIIS